MIALMQAVRMKALPAVLDSLYREPSSFEFFQAVRLLAMEALRRAHPGSGNAPVHFRSVITLAHARSEIKRLEPPKGDQPPVMTVTFLSMGGAFGPLPTSFTEEIITRRYRQHDDGPIAFLDLFHNRLVALAYAVRAKHHVALAVTSPEQTDHARYLLSLFGYGASQFRPKQACISERTLLRYSGLLANQTRSAAGLETILADHFGVRVRVQQFAGDWQAIPERQQTALGSKGRNQVLGQSVVLGRKAWDQSAGIRIHLGVVPFEQYLNFMPGRPGYRELLELVDLYSRQRLSVWLRVQVGSTLLPQRSRVVESGRANAKSIPLLRLDGRLSLGRTAWLGAPDAAAQNEFYRPGMGTPAQVAGAGS